MSDKSFGDHANRNVVKNPLLSTAVTGLSIEDLTHNAVLLPAAPTEALITRSEHQIGTQTHTLGHPENELANHPSGDSNSNIFLSHCSTTTIPTTIDHHTVPQTEIQSRNTCPTQSRTLVKSEDDFDVNEYFARLQGTRYVSAPLNSQIAEQTTSLTAAEDNLEEINLNDDKPEVTQSLTADIAQNFSQLPNVLPHVASAVFSSFSNMLSLKSRDVTPDEGKGYQYQEQVETVPLMSVEKTVQEVAPPPKEPPVSGPANYRIMTRKKYAQIPGLSSGESQSIAYSPVSQTIPSYFVPAPQDSNINITKNIENIKPVDTNQFDEVKPSSFTETLNIFSPNVKENVDISASRDKEIKPQIFTEAYNIYNPIDNAPKAASEFTSNVLSGATDNMLSFPEQNLMQSAVIPPPPMFSTQRQDSQTTGKSVLPPSVARRIGSNHPVIKQSAVQSTPLVENIFVPSFDPIPTTEFPAQTTAIPPNVPVSQTSMFYPQSLATNNSTTPISSQLIIPPLPATTSQTFGSQPSAFGPPMNLYKDKVPFAPSISTSTPSQTAVKSQPLKSAFETPKNLPPETVQSPMFPPSIPISTHPQGSGLLPPTSVIGPPKDLPSAPPGFAPTIPFNTPKIFTPPTLSTSESLPTITNIFTPLDTSIAPVLPMPSQSTTTSTSILPPTPLFPKQSAASIPPSLGNPLAPKGDINPQLSTFFSLPQPPEQSKPLVEPPKSGGPVSYRMTKKRPQYYSGPIEGVGAISNNTKPVLPPVETGTFQGALFTPSQAEPNLNVMPSIPFDISQNVSSVPEPVMAFDISKPVDAAGHFDVRQEQNAPSHFDTAFDLSRPTTDAYNANYEEHKETKGFGIIGSLKSKLSSIDINKIQNTVTTFFDPAYNESQKDDQSVNETTPFASVGQYQGQGNFEICIPNVQAPENYGSYDGQNKNVHYQDNQYYGNQYNYYQSQDQAYPGYYYPNTDTSNSYYYPYFQNQQESESGVITNLLQPQATTNTQDTSNDNLYVSSNREKVLEHVDVKISNAKGDTDKSTPEIPEQTPIDSVANIIATHPFETVSDKSSRSFFDIAAPPTDLFSITGGADKTLSLFHSTGETSPQVKQDNNILADSFDPVKLIQDVPAPTQTKIGPVAPLIEDIKPVGLFATTKSDVKIQGVPKADNLLESITKDEIPIVGVSSVPLFGLSTITADKTTELSDVNDPKISLYDAKDVDVFDTKTSISFFENIPPTELAEDENVSELNICETCREFNKPDDRDDRELEDLTTQLIENITSPIQLSNPVEVPLTESNTDSNDNTEFDTNQFEEICHITEETIETIQVQSATELLDNVNEIQPGHYGWASEQDLTNTNIAGNVNLEHDYSFKIDPNTIGFYGNNSLFFDNVPENASDEIKAEFKHHEDFPRQMSIPSAPPAEEDSKSDETGGLDVHSIEQDAKKDFPIFEEFVIEPSETDDDKIEYKEKERTDDSQERDTFTNRVERFKKIEKKEVENDEHKSIFELSSPSISMASYFDTGNFAVETHYRNSISSPSQIRIPPGFEEEFQNRLMIAQALGDVRTVPETSTQTKPTQAVTFSTVKNIAPVGFNFETNLTKLIEDSNVKLPDFTEPFGAKDETKYKDKHDIPSEIDYFVEDKHFTSTFDSRDEIEQIGTLPDIPVSLMPSNLVDEESRGSPFIIKQDDKQQISTDFVTPNLAGERNFSMFADLPSIGTDNIVEEKPFTPFDQKDISKHTGTLADISSVIGERSLSSTFETKHIPVNLDEDFTAFGTKDEVKNIDIASAPTASLFQERHFEIFGAKDSDIPVNIIPEKRSAFVPSNLFEESNFATFGQTEDAKPALTTSDKCEKLPDFSSVFGHKTDVKDEPKLADPINFFSSNDNAVEAPESLSRLASYFSSPPKTDHGKPFFELSQSQNHYRHAAKNNDSIIKDDKYIQLMKDLTSPQNIEVSKDQLIKHVNYFTVELDHQCRHFSKGDDIKIVDELTEIDDTNTPVENILRNCKYCCKNLDFDKDYKVRKFMDESRSEADQNCPNMNGNKDDSKRASAVNFEGIAVHDEANEGVSMMSEGRSSSEYIPVKHHWFYRVDVEDKSIWRGFSLTDSRSLETAYLSPELNESTLVPTDGGRYDVNIMGRLRIPVYWDDKPTNVRRCSWFYKGTTDARYVPYTEQVAEKLEEEYRHGMSRGEWHRRLALPNGEVVVMHGPGVMVHFLHSGAADSFSGNALFSFGKRVYRNPPKVRVSQDQPNRIDHLILLVHGAGEYRIQKERRESTSRPRVVRRGHDESEIEDPEPSSIDHLLLLCHGVGSACDMRFRSVEEVVEDFRATSLQLLQSHYRNSYEKGVVSRVEVLPISWHASLHSGETGVDRRLAQITLDSIPRLRHFTNDTLLDVLFYTSPVFSQTIVYTVCSELNRIYKLFQQRNPDFKGGVSLGGHSLGSVILYDLLCHQTLEEPPYQSKGPSEKTYVTGSPGVPVEYPKLAFSPDSLYALGSPIAIFECIRGVESLGLKFCLPTCKNFFNIFHPYDPIAYRIEPLINPQLREIKPLLIPHHKGRKRMHLELKDTMARVGADLKQKLLDSLKTTWNKWKSQPQPSANGQLANVEEELEKEQLNEESKDETTQENDLSTPEMLGRLNGGRRIDYVLQEAPLEMINEYIFAMSSHVGYWESEDTMLMMLREIYGDLGVQPDSTVPQQTMTVQRARSTRPDEVMLNTADYPSTSHGGV